MIREGTKKVSDTNVTNDTIDTIEKFLDQFEKLNIMYNRAQEKLIVEKVVDNESYLGCIKMAGDMIRFLDNLNPFVVQRHREPIKTTYYISAELLVRTVGLHTNRDGFNENEKSTLYIAFMTLRSNITRYR